MTVHKSAILLFAAAAMLMLPGGASAQYRLENGPKMGREGGGYRGGGGHRGMGGGLAGFGIGVGVGLVTGIIASQAASGAPAVEQPQGRRGNTAQRRTANRGSGGPPAGETRMVPDEVVIELPNSASPQTVNAMQRRFRLTAVESQSFALLGSTFYRLRISDSRSVASVVRAIEADGRVASAQPNYLYRLQQAQPAAANAAPTNAKDVMAAGAAASPSEGDPAQYAVPKMRLPEAHGIAKGDNVLVAVIDSGVDASQPELAGAIAGSFDTLKPPFTAHAHGTAIAALIAGHSRLMGSAPSARILAVHAFDPAGSGGEAMTFNIIKGLDWSVAQRARIINMSFAGPADPAIHRALEAAHRKGVVLIAAAGNAGANSPPLYPAADPNVIAVTATDAADKLFDGSNRGRHIAVAAPGVDILIAVPNGGYEVSTGTSYSAAEVSGIAALMLQRKGDLTPDAVRDTLLATAKDLGKKGRDDDFGAGLADAYRAVTELPGGRVSDAVPAK
jgi:subtilisin family serine protease